MKILNAKIKNVTMKRNVVCITFEYIYGRVYHEFDLSNRVHKKYIWTLMSYTNSERFEDLQDKIIRVIEKNHCFIGYGHPIFDKFYEIFNGEFKELNEKQIFEKLQ